VQEHADQKERRESRTQLLDVCKAIGTIRHERERYTMAMRHIHMVQRLQDSMNEVDSLVVIDCYGKKRQYLLEKEKDERNEIEEKQNV
jgi:hypothetical protein